MTPRSTSGLPEATWIVADYLDVVLHVFTPETRAYYRLEELWDDVPKLEAAATAELTPGVRLQSDADLRRWGRRARSPVASFASPGAVAQLGERLAGSQKVRGSSPLGSTLCDRASGAGRGTPTERGTRSTTMRVEVARRRRLDPAVGARDGRRPTRARRRKPSRRSGGTPQPRSAGTSGCGRRRKTSTPASTDGGGANALRGSRRATRTS